MPNGGELTNSTAKISVNADNAKNHEDVTPGNYATISIQDTGSGMAPEVLDRVFEPFFTTKEVGEGTGLGLSMVYGFVQKSDGHINLRSEANLSTTVQLYWRQSEIEIMPENGAPQNLEPAETSGGETILVVEDDEDVRTMVVNLLQRLDYYVIKADDALSALTLLESAGDIDLLLTDVVLPGGMSGVDLAESIAELRPDTKIIYSSGYPSEHLNNQGKINDSIELLRKPYRSSQLAMTVRNVLDS